MVDDKVKWAGIVINCAETQWGQNEWHSNCAAKTDMFTTSLHGLTVVLHNILIYRLNIECEPKTDSEKCLNQHRITSEIDVGWWNQQKLVSFLRCWITFWWNLYKNCSFCQFWGIFGGILGMFALNQLPWYIENRIWKSRYQIELKKLTSRSTSQLRYTKSSCY